MSKVDEYLKSILDKLVKRRSLSEISPDPLLHCNVYKTVGCAHVDGPLCNMRTCDIVVNLKITPTTKQQT